MKKYDYTALEDVIEDLIKLGRGEKAYKMLKSLRDYIPKEEYKKCMTNYFTIKEKN